jgi:hypothetical protein
VGDPPPLALATPVPRRQGRVAFHATQTTFPAANRVDTARPPHGRTGKKTMYLNRLTLFGVIGADAETRTGNS